MLAALILSLALSGQEVSSTLRDCRDDNGTDRCARLAEDLRSLGMSSLEDEESAGTEVYRILQVNGAGRLMPGVAYERRVGEAPRVVVYGAGGARRTADVSPMEWRAVQGMARFADRELVPPPGTPDSMAGICLHSWLSTVEIVNAAERGRPNGPIRRRTESACGGALTTTFAFDLASLAIKRFPDCEALDPEDYAGDMSRLQQCLRFSGDRQAAAELVNQVGWQLVPNDDENLTLAWARRLQPRSATRLDWAGQVTTGGGGARSPVAMFMAEFQTKNPSLRGYTATFDAVSSTRIEITGQMNMEGAEGAYLTAPFTQVWVWDVNGLIWSLENWTVRPFVPVR